MVFWETRRESSSVAWFLLNGSQCEGKWLAIMIFYFTIWKELGLIDIFRDEQSGLYFTLKWPAFSRGKKIRKEDFLDKHCNSFILSCQHGWQDKIKLSFIVSLLLIRKEKKITWAKLRMVFYSFVCFTVLIDYIIVQLLFIFILLLFVFTCESLWWAWAFVQCLINHFWLIIINNLIQKTLFRIIFLTFSFV